MSKLSKLCIVSAASLVGVRKILTDEALALKLGISSADRILEKTGVQARFRCDEDENLFTLLTTALHLAVARVGLEVGDIQGIFIGANPTGPFTMPNPATIGASLAGMQRFHFGGTFTGCAGGVSALNAASIKLATSQEPTTFA